MTRNSKRPAWAETIILAHSAVAGAEAVTHAARLPSCSRYFCWAEDGENSFRADNGRDEGAVKGYTDLFTDEEYDPWAGLLGAAFDEAGIAWEYTGLSYEPSTGLWHHSWSWEVCG